MSLLCLIKLIFLWQLVLEVRERFLESCSVVFGAPALKLAIFGPKFHLYRPSEASIMVKFDRFSMFHACNKLFFSKYQFKSLETIRATFIEQKWPKMVNFSIIFTKIPYFLLYKSKFRQIFTYITIFPIFRIHSIERNRNGANLNGIFALGALYFR